MRPRYAGAFYGATREGFKSLIESLNRAASEGYSPIHFSTTGEGFAVILEFIVEPAKSESGRKRDYPRFFDDGE